MTHPDRSRLERVVPGPEYPEVRERSGMVVVYLAAVIVVLAVYAAASQSARERSPVPEPTGAPPSVGGLLARQVAPDVTSPAPEGMVGGAPLTYTGRASWYGTGRGGFTAAAPWWRSGMDPEDVSVCRIDAGRSDCITVTVLDHCQCYVGERRARVIDLSRDAFSALAPLSVGLIRVQVDRGVPATLPPTDLGGRHDDD